MFTAKPTIEPGAAVRYLKAHGVSCWLRENVSTGLHLMVIEKFTQLKSIGHSGITFSEYGEQVAELPFKIKTIREWLGY